MRSRRPKFLAEMNVTSLADVSFTLMVIFLIAGVSSALSRQQGVDLELPRISRPDPQPREGLVISIKADGTLFVGQRQTARSALPRVLSEQLATGRFDRVYLHADRGVSYGVVMDVLGVVRDGGISNIGLAALPAEQ
ncbi:MAG: biopolymer transporter ExbD [candidate division WOR-3 bacterium]